MNLIPTVLYEWHMFWNWYLHITTYACITMLFSLIYHLRQPGRQADRQTAIKYFYIITRYKVCVPSTYYFLYYKNKEYVSPVTPSWRTLFSNFSKFHYVPVNINTSTNEKQPRTYIELTSVYLKKNNVVGREVNCWKVVEKRRNQLYFSTNQSTPFSVNNNNKFSVTHHLTHHLSVVVFLWLALWVKQI